MIQNNHVNHWGKHLPYFPRTMRSALLAHPLLGMFFTQTFATYCTFWMEPAAQKRIGNPAVLSCYYLFQQASSSQQQNLMTLHVQVQLTCVNSAEFRDLNSRGTTHKIGLNREIVAVVMSH